MTKTRWYLWNQKTNLTLNTTFIFIMQQVSSEFEIISDKTHKTNKDNRKFDHEVVSFFLLLNFYTKIKKNYKQKNRERKKIVVKDPIDALHHNTSKKCLDPVSKCKYDHPQCHIHTSTHISRIEKNAPPLKNPIPAKF